MPRWVPLAPVGACLPGDSLEVVVEDRVIALYNVDGTMHAIDGICPHQGGPLGKGRLEGCVVTCPWHGWQFDVRTGQHQIHPQLRQATYRVRVEKDTVMIELGELA
jgi:nitrite reductase/ring-hydroxylating ferredoxin subunit